MGLGRTNNYIEDFYFGVPLQVFISKYRRMEQARNGLLLFLTPNWLSHHTPTIQTSNYSDWWNSWTISIFIEPTDAILVVVIVTILVLILLGGVIVWKHIKEKEEDKKNQETFF